MKAKQADITIIGGGMVGLSLALALSTRLQGRASLCLVDKQPDQGSEAQEVLPFTPRVSALTPASILWLSGLGAWQNLAADDICHFSRMQVWDGEGTGSISFDAADVYADDLGVIVENHKLVRALEQALSETGGVEFIRPDTLTGLKDDGVVELASGLRIASSLVVGADGGHSRLRELGGFEVREWDYPHRAIVTTVTVEHSHEHTAWQRFMHTGPLAFLPLQAAEGDDRHFVSIVWSCEPSLCDELMALEDEAFRRRLGSAFEYRLGEVTAVNRRFSFPLQQRHAVSYVKPGLALLGDAAHTIHPLAGQGVNLGFQDAEALCTVLRDATDAHENPGHVQVLSRYQRQRKVHNLGMMATMEGFARLFGSTDIGLTWLRNAGMNAVNSALPVRKALVRRAMGL